MGAIDLDLPKGYTYSEHAVTSYCMSRLFLQCIVLLQSFNANI